MKKKITLYVIILFALFPNLTESSDNYKPLGQKIFFTQYKPKPEQKIITAAWGDKNKFACLVTNNQDEKEIYIYDIKKQKTVETYHTKLGKHSLTGTAILAFSKENDKLAVTKPSSEGNKLLVLQLKNKAKVKNIVSGDHEKQASIFALSWNPHENNQFALFSNPNIHQYKIVDETAKEQTPFPCQPDTIRYSHSGKYLACIKTFNFLEIKNLQNKNIKIRKIITNLFPRDIKFIPKKEDIPKKIPFLTAHPEQKKEDTQEKDVLVVSGSENKITGPVAIFITEILNNELKILKKIRVNNQISAMDISPDGKYIIIATGNYVQFIETNSGIIKKQYNFYANGDKPSKIQFSQTGKYILTLDTNKNSLKIWKNPLSNSKHLIKDIVY